MSKFYTLSNAAGLIRSNKFNDKADAICVASFRAEFLKLPIKIYEHEGAEKQTVLVCNPDGSVDKPGGVGYEMVELGNESSGLLNESQANILLSSYDESPLTTFYLKTDMPENLVQLLEKELGVDLGLYDPQTLHAYTHEPEKIRNIEAKLSEAKVEVERLSGTTLKKSVEAVTAAKKAHKLARASRLPEFRVRATNKFGSSFKFSAHCEIMDGDDKKAPAIKIFVDGSPVGEVKSERDASKVISEQVEKAFSKFLKKELS